jgi:dTDP-3-amino-3,4,6-trideoxy-alpha-D-glucopyranose N,N-dimethyltransferase
MPSTPFLCLFSSIGYISTKEELEAAVVCMATHLSTNGTLIVDGWVRPDAWREGTSIHSVAANGADIAVARVSRAWREDEKSVLEMHHLVATADGVELVVDRHELTLFKETDYRRAFDSAGLICERVDSPMPGRDRYICGHA